MSFAPLRHALKIRLIAFVAFAFSLAMLVGVIPSSPLRFRSIGTTFSVVGAYGAGATSDVKAAGFNTVNAMSWTSRSALDALHASGFKAVLWTGDYDPGTCQFERSDGDLTADLQRLAGHPAIVAWQLSDEPNQDRPHCPNVAQQHLGRQTLVHKYDARPGYVALSTNDTNGEYFAYKYWSGMDLVGLVVYPCKMSATATWPNTVSCDWSMIDNAVAAAASNPHYWAIPGAFKVCWTSFSWCYAVPSPSLMTEQMQRWAQSRAEGYFLYTWTQQASWMFDWLSAHPDVIEALAQFNSGALASPTPSASVPVSSPTPSPISSPLPSPTSSTGPLASPSPTPDSLAPTKPANAKGTWKRRGTRLWWSASWDDRGVAGYRITRDGVLIGTTRYTSYIDSSPGTVRHVYTIVAYDAAQNVSPPASVIVDPGPGRLR